VASEPHEDLWEPSTGAVTARCLNVLAELGVADRITGTAQLSALFDRAGLTLVRVVDTTGPMRIVEARPA
jgi:hypothetical protein